MTTFKTCINKKMCSPYIVVKSMQIVFLSNRAIQRTAFSSKYVNTRFLNKKKLARKSDVNPCSPMFSQCSSNAGRS